MRSSALARLAGVSPDTLRHYELKGLLPAPQRTANGYRDYSAEALARVRVIRNALSMGFTLDELARILKTRDRGGVPCREVRDLASAKLEALEARVAELRDACDRIRRVVKHWDTLLDRTPAGKRAALLDALAGLVEQGAPSPLVPPGLRRRACTKH
jgi:MerR family transcriptional regulator, Zn(II)-responsive regulator of zntA